MARVLWVDVHFGSRASGHAVAASHYDCPIKRISIARKGYGLGATLLGVSRPVDAIAIFCGPLAERSPGELRPDTAIQTIGPDEEALRYLQLNAQQAAVLVTEALAFMRQAEVQQQIDRVARVLIERITLTANEAREISGFEKPLPPPGPEW